MRDSTLKISNPKVFKKYFKKGDFIFNIGTMMAGNVSAQLVVVLLAPVITRLYLPEHFGMIAMVMSFVGVLSVISCMGYEMSVILPKSEEKSLNLVAVCLSLTLVCSLILLSIVPFLPHVTGYNSCSSTGNS